MKTTRNAATRASLEPSVREMRLDDATAILELERVAFPDIPHDRLWRRHQVEAHVHRYPDGQWVVERDGRVLGSAMNMRTTWERATGHHRWREITGDGTLATHLPDGEILYGTEIMVHPHARRMGLGRRLFERRFRHVLDHGLRAFVTGGRLPGYRHHADRMVPQEYVAAVQLGDLTDPVLTPQLKWGLTPLGILGGYIMDPSSCHYATLVTWENPERDGLAPSP